jgi:dipeptidyl aminopeptidase/acylaminoacyl peptidase
MPPIAALRPTPRAVRRGAQSSSSRARAARGIPRCSPHGGARTAATALAFAVAFASSCAAPRPADPAALRAAARPTLADIFSIPGLHGSPPTLRSLSSDGRFAVVDFKPVERRADGALAWGEDHSPHLVSTESGPHTLDAGSSLSALLERLIPAPPAPAPLSEPEAVVEPGQREAPEARRTAPGAFAWSEAGAVMAVEWRGALALVDPAAATARVLHRDPPEPAPNAPKAENSDEPEPRRLGRIRSLGFANDDRELEVRTGDELYVFDLALAHEGPASLDAARCITADAEPRIGDLQLSDDRTRAFATAGTFGALDDNSKAPTRFLDLASGRKVVLEGLHEILSLEGERLSPDGRWVFAVEADRTKDPAPNLVPNFLSPRVSTVNARRDLADDLPPPRKLWMWATGDGARRELLLPGESIYDFQPLGWAPQETPEAPARFGFRRLSSDFRVQELWVWNDGDLRLVAVDRDPKWVGGPGGGARWTRDGQRIVFTSESFASSSTPGRSQLFEVDVESGHARQLTNVEGEVSTFVQHDGGIALVASDGDPNQRVLLRVDDAGARKVELGAAMASSPRVSRDGSRVVFELEQLGRPAELYVLETDALRPLTNTLRAEYAAHPWILPQELAVEHADGTRVWAHVYLPRASKLERGDRPRPCVVFIHGAGYLQNVTQSMTQYAVNLMFHSRLAEMGFVVVDVDYRGSAGYGQRFRTDVQGQLGKLELEDINAVVDELARRKVVDAQRVGCYGGSYGGFLTLMALFTQPERWSCGAALRSVTDWRSYSAGYTQPRLGRPSTHPEAYARSSPIDHAEKLEDPLLILHGMSDTNVFAQDSIRLIEKLIDLGKPFDAMLYPSQGHGFEDGPHWIDEYGRIERLMLQHLGQP